MMSGRRSSTGTAAPAGRKGTGLTTAAVAAGIETLAQAEAIANDPEFVGD